MARPRKEINQDEFEKLCHIQCTLVEISEWFDCSEDTIERWVKRTYLHGFAEIFKKKSSRGKISLRRKMFDLAFSGNVTMCIWLSKQHLGMKEKYEMAREENNSSMVISLIGGGKIISGPNARVDAEKIQAEETKKANNAKEVENDHTPERS